jgi:hypothetical protein
MTETERKTLASICFSRVKYGAEIVKPDNSMKWMPMDELRAAYAAYFHFCGRPPVPDDEVENYVAELVLRP